MSLAHVKSPKHCANKQEVKVQKRYKKLFLGVSAFLSTISLLILLLWLILRPSKPEFRVKQADVYQLNLIDDLHLLNSSIQLTLSSKNPNHRLGIYYDNLQVYAVYKGQQITLPTSLPPFYQGYQEANLLTAFLAGSRVPVAPSFGYEVGRDQSAGRFVLNLKAMGRLRWKVGSWVSGGYRFNVNCVAVMPFGPTLPTPPLTLNQPTRCSTTL
ncbi:NDR1/HIN1-like protein 12 [Cucumis melo var. makuwa]|uniref:NDR1/HIN1-like protein 12 n=1 Tax=Cucumis melo var. makuwa TaxID=1194695 RepID=A0A5D3C6B2_CUCMM|nr:NDR1/HIN1-like protein 12 [Cucumis melo var. makuwa]TYK05919.1 NDR1/HIN1-like protein 12 [Cucumis melo var. makuwa]